MSLKYIRDTYNVPAKRGGRSRPRIDQLSGPGARHKPPDRTADPDAADAAARLRGDRGWHPADRNAVTPPQ